MAWKKGQSGNPKGRPPEQTSIRALLALELEASVKFLAKVRDDAEESTRDRVKAAEHILAYGLAKPASEPAQAATDRLAIFVEAMRDAV